MVAVEQADIRGVVAEVSPGTGLLKADFGVIAGQQHVEWCRQAGKLLGAPGFDGLVVAAQGWQEQRTQLGIGPQAGGVGVLAQDVGDQCGVVLAVQVTVWLPVWRRVTRDEDRKSVV